MSHSLRRTLVFPFLVLFSCLAILVAAQTPKPGFHNAPPSAKEMQNPYANQKSALQVGKKRYEFRCSRCHGVNAEGSGNIPALVDGALESVTPGEVFWFV